jgi:hypothetical protein
MSEITVQTYPVEFRKGDIFTMGLNRSWKIRLLAWWHNEPPPLQTWVVTDVTNSGPGGIVGIEPL